jgi:hypothetical protein
MHLLLTTSILKECPNSLNPNRPIKRDVSNVSSLVAYLHQRMATLWPKAEMFRAVLPELLSNPTLREQYYQQVIEPTIVVAEAYFHSQIEQGQMRAVNIPLTVRTIASMVFGLLVLQLLGDASIAEQWEELPEVLGTMIVEGLQPQEKRNRDEHHEHKVEVSVL